MAETKYVSKENEAYIWEKTKNKFVEKETGKGLSEANYTQTEKAKLENIESGAEVNVNADWDATTGDAAILNKPENLVQDASYVHTDSNYTAAEKNKLEGIEEEANKTVVDTAMSDSSENPPQNKVVKSYIDSAIGALEGVSFEKVSALPASGSASTIYLVPNSGSSPNTYDEYIWIKADSKFEKIGTTDVDLSGYVLSSDLVPLTTAEIDAICV